MKYVVAEGHCFYNNGIDYLPGMEIKKEIFKPESAFDDFVAKGHILAIEAKTAEKKAEVKEDKKEAEAAKTEEAPKKGKK